MSVPYKFGTKITSWEQLNQALQANFRSIDTSIAAAIAAGGGGGGTTADASTTVKGISKLSVAPAVAASPIAVGDNDPRMSDARVPSGSAGGDLTGTYPNPTVAAGAITDTKVAAANKDGAAVTASMRTLGTGALQAAAGNDSRFSDARTPTAHAASHAAAGSDPITISESQVTNLVSDLAGKQPLDADLTTIAGLTATTDSFMQAKAGAWAARTIAQVKTDLAISNVDNTSDANKPVSTAQAAADALKVTKAGDTYTGTHNMTGATVTVPTVAIAAGSNAASIGAVNTALGAYMTQTSADARYLQLTGGTMSGIIALGSNSVTANNSVNALNLTASLASFTNLLGSGYAQLSYSGIALGPTATTDWDLSRTGTAQASMGSGQTLDLSAGTTKVASATQTVNDTTAASTLFARRASVKTIPHTFSISGSIAVPSGATNFIPGFFVPVPSGKTVKLIGCRYDIRAGTSVTVDVQKNGTGVTGFTALSVTTTATSTTPTAVTLAVDDKIALVVTAVSGSPDGLSFTLYLEYSDT